MVQTKTEQEKGPKKIIQTEELADATDQPSLFFSFSYLLPKQSIIFFFKKYIFGFKKIKLLNENI